MRKNFSFLSFLLLPFFIVGLSLIFSSNASAAPSLRVLPNPVPEGEGATLSVSGCGNQQEAIIYWDKNSDGDSVDNVLRTTNPSGDVAYFHSEFSEGTYSAWVECNNSSSKDAGYTFQTVGECEYVTALKTTTPLPHTNTTAFTITGRILNCPDYQGQLQGGLQLRGGEEPDFGKPSYAITQTDTQGNFTLEGVVLEKVGTYTLTLWGPINNRTQPLPGNSSITITTTEGQKLECGDTAAQGDERCPESCPSVPNRAGDGWVCEAITCLPAEEALHTLSECSGDGLREDPVACNGEVGAGCSDKDATLCYEGEKTVENIKCQTDKVIPTPTPPLPPCAGGNFVYKTNDEGESVRAFTGCNTVATGFGRNLVVVSPEFLIRDIFSVLLGLSGGIALLLIIRSGYQILTSQGDPEKLKEARERLTSAIIGLLFLIFSLVILEVIGVDILGIPGLR